MFIANIQVGTIRVQIEEVGTDEEKYLCYSIILEDGQTLSLTENEFADLRTIANMLRNEDIKAREQLCQYQ